MPHQDMAMVVTIRGGRPWNWAPPTTREKMKDYITEGIALIIGFIIGANMLYLAHSDVRATAAKANAAIQKCERELPRSQTCVVSATPN